MGDSDQDPRYRSRSHRPASSQTTNQSAYSSSHPGQPVYTPYSGGAQESQLPGHSSSYSTSSHAPGGHTPHVPFPETPQGQISLQSSPAEYPETYPSHSSTTPYSTQVAQDPYDSVGYQASGHWHAQGGHTPDPSFPVQPQRQRSVPRQSEPRGPQEDYSVPSQTSPPLAGASPQGSYGYGGHQPASHVQGGHVSHPPFPGQFQPQRSVPRQSEPRGPPKIPRVCTVPLATRLQVTRKEGTHRTLLFPDNFSLRDPSLVKVNLVDPQQVTLPPRTHRLT
ncbi:hypothetical protein BC826DRAFT_640936 [Russula brevipes]|nr:hypothetical protein BC826DRAFT_640936 [Russula brevipes]